MQSRWFLLVFLFSINIYFVCAAPTLNSTTIIGAFYNGTDYVFSPDGDGSYDSVTIMMNSSELVKFGTIFIYNSSWNKVDRFNAQSTFKYNKTVTWDGHYSSSYGNASLAVPSGIYLVNLTLTDQSNNSNTFTVINIFVNGTINSSSVENNSNSSNSPESTNSAGNNTESSNASTDNITEENSTIVDSNLTSLISEKNPTPNKEETVFPIDHNESTENVPSMITMEGKHAYNNTTIPVAISLLSLTTVLLLVLILMIAKLK